jgi:hypothetical protein
MKYPGYDTGDLVLSEGKWFPFRIHNRVQLQDDKWYFVLVDINKLKHFMPAEHYSRYGFKIGDEIICKIDRINCTGRIFLEPKHPYYSEGEIYQFDVDVSSCNDNKQILIVKEILGNSIEVPVYDITNSIKIEKNKVRCTVKSIKKGKPILEFCSKYP